MSVSSDCAACSSPAEMLGVEEAHFDVFDIGLLEKDTLFSVSIR